MLAINSSIPSKILETPEDVEVLTVQLPVDNPVSLCLLLVVVQNISKSCFHIEQSLLNPILL